MRKNPFFPDLPCASRTRRTVLMAPACMAVLVPVIILGWPVDVLEIRDVSSDHPACESPVVARMTALLGREVRASIIHSVQLSPVIDEYRILEGRIWAWRERIMSHNAGLPSLKPERGRFVYDPPWMIVEGTGESWETFFYRVGTGELGKNEICLMPRPCRELWRDVPGKRLVFQVIQTRL